MDNLYAIGFTLLALAVGFWMGVYFQRSHTAKRLGPAIKTLERLQKMLEEPEEKSGLTEAEALAMYETQLIYDCPLFDECGATSGELCKSNGVWIHAERFLRAEEGEAPLYDAELSYNETPEEPGVWEEVELGDCDHGCKVYEHKRTGRRVLMHNSTYGCRL